MQSPFELYRRNAPADVLCIFLQTGAGICLNTAGAACGVDPNPGNCGLAVNHSQRKIEIVRIWRNPQGLL